MNAYLETGAAMEENANLRFLDDTIRRNNALFEALLKNCSEGITLTGPDRRIVRVVHGLTGIRPGDLTGVPIESLVIPEDREIVLSAYRELLSRRSQKLTEEIRVFRADGEIRRFSVTLTDMLDDPNVQGVVWNYADVTTRQERSPRATIRIGDLDGGDTPGSS